MITMQNIYKKVILSVIYRRQISTIGKNRKRPAIDLILEQTLSGLTLKTLKIHDMHYRLLNATKQQQPFFLKKQHHENCILSSHNFSLYVYVYDKLKCQRIYGKFSYGYRLYYIILAQVQDILGRCLFIHTSQIRRFATVFICIK